jgi:glutathione S-transferase
LEETYMKDIEKNVKIAAPIDEVWIALTSPAAIRGWMGDDSKIEVDLKVGGRYRLFGGDTTGAFTHVNRPNTLEYTWRQGEWLEEWADSLVRWELKSSGKGTQVHLVHSQFPNAEERDSHDEGWDMYWLGPMKDWLEGRA